MITKNLSRRLERLEDSLLPANEEPTVIVICPVNSDGKRALDVPEIRFTVHACPRPPKARLR